MVILAIFFNHLMKKVVVTPTAIQLRGCNMGTTHIASQERSEEVLLALSTLLSRDEDPKLRPDGELRMGNVLDLAYAAKCTEAAHTLTCMLDVRGVKAYGVDDDLIVEICNFLRPERAGFPDVLCEEIQLMIDLAKAAGLHAEVDFMLEIWDDHKPFHPAHR